uniref:MYND-type domain-containing protein n=1 Tax=Attheya septentrionalis TaxID=420275 RepID=A0A7S2UFB7_9STRA|mmetsp:Transcript_23156/g.41830  ORF Transcript_23156/g.41830 Transcript_23156/m.41830 type:complete len:282 (+) Transcript_23156:123-968(+)
MPSCLNPPCRKETKSICGGCKCVYFCGRECQVSIWKHHKHLCKGLGKQDDKECLIVDGMGPLGRDDIGTVPITNALKARGMESTVAHIDKGMYIPEQLALILQHKTALRVCIILGWGSGDDDFGCNDHDGFRQALVSWVQETGGTLIVQGERIAHAAGNWPEWFGLSWKSSDYSRTIHDRNPEHWSIPWFASDREAPNQAKSCMINQVEKHDILFGTTKDSKTFSPVPGFGGRDVGPGHTTFAVSKCGKGVVSFSGDVNAEKETIATIAIISQASSSSRVE